MKKTLKATLASALRKCGCEVEVKEDALLVSKKDRTHRRIFVKPELEKEFQKYANPRSSSFDIENRVYTFNNSYEVMVTRLKPELWKRPKAELTDRQGNKVIIAEASLGFQVAFLESPLFEKYFSDRSMAENIESYSYAMQVSEILWSPVTARYVTKGRSIPTNLADLATGKIRDCLFKLAVERNDVLQIWSAKLRFFGSPIKHDESASSIPDASFDSVACSYYMVGTASVFVAQRFLSYYHVLEYHFLTVSESRLHERLKAVVNDPRFDRSSEGISKLISTVRGQDAARDETEMLRGVIDRYVSEADLLEFVASFEAEDGKEKIYSKHRSIFGEKMQGIVPGVAVSHAANLIKFIRNSIVHSSDRYKRSERFIPLSESEAVIQDYIPLVKFLAEKVIYGTAS